MPRGNHSPVTGSMKASPARSSSPDRSRVGKACIRSWRCRSFITSPATNAIGKHSRTSGGASSNSTATTTADFPPANRLRAIPITPAPSKPAARSRGWRCRSRCSARRGNSIVADELELTTLNSGLGLWSPSGRWATYNTPMDGVRKASAHEIVFQSREGSPELNCCSVNAARALGMISDWALMTDADGYVVNWYGAGSTFAQHPRLTPLGLIQRSDYPRTSNVDLTVVPRGKRVHNQASHSELVDQDDGVRQRRDDPQRRFRAVFVDQTEMEEGRHDFRSLRLHSALLGRRTRVQRQDLRLSRSDPPYVRPLLQRHRFPRRPDTSRRRLSWKRRRLERTARSDPAPRTSRIERR